ncbi:putative non-specific serine/threonine protein kinase [Medicago truncatula]|uniref:Putative non-specific serine/threonine protein kinase n=1 Tax=Medicago truncatula TaxID=3880 RepID=A0A396HAN0_MEDTR|nr:receptor-like protein EIX2 [Medicago truncatula]RHN50286.1 putative non-specific serine/threonine protein kinase [Medicago truncatula]
MLYCGFKLLFCLVTILCINWSCAEDFHTNKCVEKEKRALLKFRDAINLKYRDGISSWKGEECCKWEGISCDNLTGHVTSLDLEAFDYTKALRGKLDSSICELQHLTSLNLHGNQFEGKIPKCIGSLDKLIELNLHDNNLVSVIPPSLGNLSNLQTLDLGYNSLTTNDLEWLSHLSNLRYLDLSYVNLTQAVDWLSSISKIRYLSQLNLYGCGLHQVNPKSIPLLNTSIFLKSLDLSDNGLNSSIVPWVINVSKVLTHLDLSNNQIESSVLKSFRNMSQLQELLLNTNKLSEKLSDNIQQLCLAKNGLRKLDLSNNPFNVRPLPNFSCFPLLETLSLQNTNVIGPFPKSFVHLRSLAYLDLSFNQLNGSQPLFEITKLISLDTLYLSHNHLSGPIPHTIGQLSGLRSLFLSSNKLIGVINETHLSNLSQLTFFDVSQNSLSFNFSLDWVPPFKLFDLYASSCILGPKFPVWLRHQGGLEYLDISHSSISDSFPKWFWKLSLSLRYLNVSHNILKGMLPKSFTKTKVYDRKLYVWDFSFNNLNGSLPAFPELGALFLSNNMFTGSLSSFCTSSSQNLIHLDLSSNMLVGPLPDCWEKFQSLRVLNLAQNYLSGKVPNSLGALEKIESLHLNNNNFSGEIPSLILCQNLKLIDVGDNNLQGALPMWIGHHLHQLIVLRMRGNKFQGNIPTSLCNLSFLQVLDLSENNITGEIPQCFDQIVALTNLKFPRKIFQHFPFIAINIVQNEWNEIGIFNDKEILAWKGSNREYGKILELAIFIDLSCNQLTGEIPQSITKLAALASLNLSRNNLTGLIPNNIGHMKMLESLDLSRNHLSGRMPTSFSNLTSLSYMNLSFNNLEGKIPISTQLQTFDSYSYVGNNRLCGPPLINLCPADVISSTRINDKHVTIEEDEDKLITFGFYVSLVLGFIIGFWGVCGSLVIKTSWRHAYFKFFNNMNDWIHITLAVFVNRLKKRFQVED